MRILLQSGKATRTTASPKRNMRRSPGPINGRGYHRHSVGFLVDFTFALACFLNTASLLAQSGNDPIVYTPSFVGSDCGLRTAAALNAIYALGGGTVDMRGETNCTLNNDLYLGDGTHSVTVFMPIGTITANHTAETGVRAVVYYNSYLTLIAPQTTISGDNSAVALEQAYEGGGVTDVSFNGPNVLDTGTVVPGMAAVEIGGPNISVPVPAGPANISYPNNWLMSTMGGYGGMFAVYSTALSAAAILKHYNCGTLHDANCTGSNGDYETTVEADSPLSFWPLVDTAGAAAVDVVGGRNGTYTGTVTLSSGSGLTGQPGTNFPLFDQSTGSVTLPTYNWFPNSSAFTLEGWVNPTSAPGPWRGAMMFYDSWLVHMVGLNDWAENCGCVYVYVESGAEQASMHPTFPQEGFGQNALLYFAYTYSGGNVALYLNGTKVRTGTDVSSSSFENMNIGGADIGVLADSEHGCDLCYSQFDNVNVGGATYGALFENSSGYAFGDNQFEWDNSRFVGPVGKYLAPNSAANAVFNHDDYEGNQSTTGSILFVYPHGTSAGFSGTACNVGDTVRPAGGNNNALLTVAGATGGAPNAWTITAPGTGYGNVMGDSTVTMTGSCSGATVDIVVSAASIFDSGGGVKETDPYEEDSGQDYVCGSGTFILDPAFSGSGGVYSPDMCTGPSGAYGGPDSDVVVSDNDNGLTVNRLTVGALFNNSELWTNPCPSWNAGGSITWDLGGNTRGNCIIAQVGPGTTSTLNLANVAPAGHYTILFWKTSVEGTATLNLGSGCSPWMGNTGVLLPVLSASPPVQPFLRLQAVSEAQTVPAGAATDYEQVNSETITNTPGAIDRLDIDILGAPGWACLINFH